MKIVKYWMLLMLLNSCKVREVSNSCITFAKCDNKVKMAYDIKDSFYFDTLKYNKIVHYSKLLCLPSYRNDNSSYEIDKLVTIMDFSAFLSSYGVLSEKYLTIVISPLPNRGINKSTEASDLDCRYVIVYSFRDKRYYRIAGFKNNDVEDFLNHVNNEIKSLKIISLAFHNNCYLDIISPKAVQIIDKKYKSDCDYVREYAEFIIY